MTAYLHNKLTYVWAFLTVITVASWWVGRGAGAAFELNAAVTVSVLVMAAVKAQLVIQYFMEVRSSALWLKVTAYGWIVVVLLLLLGAYWLAL